MRFSPLARTTESTVGDAGALQKVQALEDEYKQHLRALREHERQENKRLEEIRQSAVAATRDCLVTCQSCRGSQRLGDFELVREIYQSYWYDDEWHSEERTHMLCPFCHDSMTIPKPLLPYLFLGGLESYVKKIHEWDSQHHCLSGDVERILKPALDKIARREKEAEHQRKLQEARRLLDQETESQKKSNDAQQKRIEEAKRLLTEQGFLVSDGLISSL